MPAIDPTTPTRVLAELRPTLELIPSDRLETIRVDIEAAVVQALGVTQDAMAFQEAARSELGDSFADAFGKLEPAAQACSRAHADHVISLHGTEVDEMIAALSAKRSLLLTEAQSLVGKKRIPGSLLSELHGGTGYRDMTFDVMQLVGAFRKDWASIEAHTPVTSTELDEAEAFATTVMKTLGENGQADSSSSPSAELRQRAYTYFVQTYSEVRRAMTFLRWEAGDVDEIVPSLFAGRTRRKDDDAVVPSLTTPVVATPVVIGLP